MEHPSKLLKRLGISPLKSFGQNFLLHTGTLANAETLFNPRTTLLEIGPGLGALTEYFLTRGFKMVLCEKDKTLAARLQSELAPRVSVIQGDFLKVPESTWQESGATQAVGNLPFYITAPIITRTVAMPFIDRFLYGIQKDVADKIIKPMGNSLALYLYALGDAKIFAPMKKGNFYPVPKVDAAWVYWQKNRKVKNIEDFELILRAAFWGKRKSLHNSLTKNPFFQAPGLELKNELIQNNLKKAGETLKNLLQKRPDQLNFEEFHVLYTELFNGAN